MSLNMPEYGWILQNIPEKTIKCLNKLFWPGAQPKGFQVRESFVELGHFNKPFFKNTRKKKAPQAKILEIFLLDTLKTAFWMEDSG